MLSDGRTISRPQGNRAALHLLFAKDKRCVMFTNTIRRYAPALPLLGLAAGALFLIPGDENAQPVAAMAMVADRPSLPSYVVRLPDPAARTVDIASIAPVATAAVPTATPTQTSLEVPPTEVAAISGTEAEARPEAGTELAHAISAVNVRAGPSTSTARLFVLQPGEPVRTAGSSDGWVEVISATGETGWVYARYLDNGAAASGTESASTETSIASVETEEPDPIGQRARLTGDASVHAAPSRSAERLFILDAGERVSVAETRGNWARVVLDSGVSGWVRMQ